MHKRWPFFQTLVANLDMVLAKTDLGIASRYAELVPDVELRDRIFGRIRGGVGADEEGRPRHHRRGRLPERERRRSSGR